MRRLVRTLAWIGLACIAIGLVTTTAVVSQVRAANPRDETAYLRDAHRYTRDDGGLRGYDTHVQMTDPSDRELIEAGDRACRWLAQQPPALFVTTYRFSPRRLADVYWRFAWNSQWAMPRQVYRDAWDHLCPATLYLVRPHYVFSDPPHD